MYHQIILGNILSYGGTDEEHEEVGTWDRLDDRGLVYCNASWKRHPGVVGDRDN